MHLRNDAYMICCPARSGSTLLVHLLRSHPGILSHGEIMGKRITGLSGPLGTQFGKDPDVMKTLEGIRHARPETYLYSYILHPHGHKAVGFKLKYEELGSRSYTRILDFVRADKDIKILFLDRENLFELLRVPLCGHERDGSDARAVWPAASGSAPDPAQP